MRYLFERLTRGAGDAFDLHAAVALQIQHLVTSLAPGGRGDDATDVLGFGMPSVVDVGRRNSPELERYAARLQRLIEHYEPRLQRVGVEIEATGSVSQPHRLVVTGTLAAGGETRDVRLPLAPSEPR